MNVFNVMLRGVHCINNASSIFLFSIQYAFAFVKIMYFECRNKQFEERKHKVSYRQVGRKIITKRIKVNFIYQQGVSAVVGEFVKQAFKKQCPHGQMTCFTWVKQILL